MLGLVAAGAPSLTVDVTGKCPSVEAVAVALGSAVGSDTKPGAGGVPKVTNLGDRFSVSAFGQAREYPDPGRDCDERARAAAVFIALALNPPSFQHHRRRPRRSRFRRRHRRRSLRPQSRAG